MKQDKDTAWHHFILYVESKGKSVKLTRDSEYNNGGGCLGMGRGYKKGTNFQL